MNFSHREFVDKYKKGQIEVYIHRTNPLRIISMGYVPKKYYWAHTFWSWIWFLLIPIGIILIFVKGLLFGVGTLIVCAMLGTAVKKSAQEFMLKQALENEAFYKFCIEDKVLVINEK